MENTSAMAKSGTQHPWQPSDCFSRLPSELIAMVADHLQHWNILALRSVCSVIHHGVERHFLDAFFATRRHVDTPSSLEVLVSISEHPILRKRLRCLELTITHPYDHTIIPHGKTLKIPTDSWPLDNTAEVDNMHTCMSLLTKALGNLERSRIYPKIMIHPSSKARSDDFFTPDNNDVLSFAFVALGRTQFPVMDLDISSLSSWHPACASTYELASVPLLRYPRAPRWKYLTKLKFAMPRSPAATLRDRYGVVDARRKDFAPLGRWLSSLHSLQQLIISFYHSLGPRPYAVDCQRLQGWMANMKLRTLGIIFGTFEMSSFCNLLASQPSLYSLQLWSVDFTGQGHWSRVLRVMASHMRLEYVELRKMIQDKGVLSLHRLLHPVPDWVEDCDHTVVYRGAEQVQQGLLKLADDLAPSLFSTG